MFFILICLYFFHSTINAAPVSHVLRDTIPPDLNCPSSQCVCPGQQRSLWDIIGSCVATIFACTWVSVHPNIPPSGEKWWKTRLRRLELMLWALIAPELIIMWAMRQWYGARTIVEHYYGHGWTKTHAYFTQMGGFILFEQNKPQRVLLPSEMEDLLLEGRIDLPKITEAEIQDRSKGDDLSKALAIGQTSWFVAQCIARLAKGLILTEFELVTAAFAVLNGVMYYLWWNKPLDVRCPVPVYFLDEPKPVEERFNFKATKETVTCWLWDAICSLFSGPMIILGCSVTWILKSKDVDLKMLQQAVMFIVISPCHTLEVTGSISTVSTFYASNDYTSKMVDIILLPSVASTIAALFGGLHCVAWFFTFPSHAELIIWRVCSSAILIIPLGMLFAFVVGFCAESAESNSWLQKSLAILTRALAIILIIICLPIYAIARLLLLGEAFAALRYLPPDALKVVDWLASLPHI